MRELVCEDRLKSMIIKDKCESNDKIERILKSELLFVLKNYFELCSEDLSVKISVNSVGKFQIDINAESRNFKIAHLF